VVGDVVVGLTPTVLGDPQAARTKAVPAAASGSSALRRLDALGSNRPIRRRSLTKSVESGRDVPGEPCGCCPGCDAADRYLPNPMCSNFTSGDPARYDHVLLANLVRMLDERAGWKAADTALWREHVHAATLVGRVASTRVAVELGYGIEADEGRSGRLRHSRIAGVPDEVIRVHSKRATEIQDEIDRRDESSYRAQGIAARATPRAKRHQSEAELLPRWQAELQGVAGPSAASIGPSSTPPGGLPCLRSTPARSSPRSSTRIGAWPWRRCSLAKR
jgi:hypothetical protein